MTARERHFPTDSSAPNASLGVTESDRRWPTGVAPQANRPRRPTRPRSSRCRRACIRASPASDAARRAGVASGDALHGLRRPDEPPWESLRRARTSLQPQPSQRPVQHAGLAAARPRRVRGTQRRPPARLITPAREALRHRPTRRHPRRSVGEPRPVDLSYAQGPAGLAHAARTLDRPTILAGV